MARYQGGRALAAVHQPRDVFSVSFPWTRLRELSLVPVGMHAISLLFACFKVERVLRVGGSNVAGPLITSVVSCRQKVSTATSPTNDLVGSLPIAWYLLFRRQSACFPATSSSLYQRRKDVHLESVSPL